MKLRLLYLIAAAVLVLAVAGCSSSPQTFTLKVTIDAPIYAAGIGQPAEQQSIGTSCDGGSEDSTASLSNETLHVQDQHGKSVQSQVMSSGKIAAYEGVVQSCRFVVHVADVPATGSKYRVKVGKWTSPLVSPSKAKNGFEIGLDE